MVSTATFSSCLPTCCFKKNRQHNFYSAQWSPNIIEVIKSSGMRWAGHVERMEGRRGAYRVLAKKPDEKRVLEILRH
jgi:hypothetical protein